MIKHIRRGHRGTRLAPKYRGIYGEAKENNIGVFQGSATIALIFIIYWGDMMEGLSALDRRSKLPMRIIQDRPHGQNKKQLWGNKRRGRTMRRSSGSTHNQQCRNKQAETRSTQNDPIKKRIQEELSEAYRRRQQAEHEEEQRSSESNMEQETTGTEMPQRNHREGEARWQKVDRRAIIIETNLEISDGGGGKKYSNFK